MVPKHVRPTILLAALLAAGLLFLSAGGTTSHDSGLGFGSVSAPSDPDVTALLSRPEEESSVCYHDGDESGDYSVEDSVYLALGAQDCSLDPGTVTTDWVRVTPHENREAGSLVRPAHGDHGASVGRIFDVESPDAGLLWYYDAQGTGTFTAGDIAYLSEDASVNLGDVRLSGGGTGGPGSQVQEGADDLNLHLTPWVASRLTDAAYYLEVDQEPGFTRRDLPYLLGANRAIGDDTMPTVNELRFGPFSEGKGFGSRLEVTDPDATAFLRDDFGGSTLTGDASICAHSEEGTGSYRPGDPVFFVPGSTNCHGGGNVRAGDVRLTGENPGSVVRPGDDDHELGPFVQLDGDGEAGPRFLSYWDTRDTPFGSFHEGDVLYLMTSDDHDRARAGDIRLTPFGSLGAGSIVQTGDGDQNVGVEPFVPDESIDHISLFAYYDLDSNEEFDQGDLLYLRSDAQKTTLFHNTVRLGSLKPGLGYGSVTQAGDSDTVTRIHRLEGQGAQASVFCGIDMDGNDVLNPQEPVIIARGGSCQDRSASFDLRVSSTEHGPAGSFIQGGESDWNRALVEFDESVCLDRTASSSKNLMDRELTLYLTRCMASVQEGDLRLTPAGSREAGTRVTQADEDHGDALQNGEDLQGHPWDPNQVVYYHDAKETGRLSRGDSVYFAIHPPDQEPPGSEGLVQVHYVRLLEPETFELPESPPGAPENLVVDEGDQEVEVSWDPPGEGPVDEYIVQWGEASGDYSESLTVQDPSAPVSGLENNVVYYFVVIAVNPGGEGPPSEEVAAVPTSGSLGLPSQPLDLQGSVVRDGSVLLQWQPPQEGEPILGYRVGWGGLSGGPYPEEAETDETEYHVEGLDSDRSHSFVVHAINTVGEGPPSEEFTIEPMDEEEGTPGLTAPVVLIVLLLVLWSQARNCRTGPHSARTLGRQK